MRHRFRLWYFPSNLALLGIAVLAILAYGVLSSAAQPEFISIGGGRVSEVIVRLNTTVTIKTSRTFSNLVVGNPEIADIVPLAEDSLYVQGKAAGLTNISIYDEQQNLLGVIDVRVQLDFTNVASAIRAAAPASRVSVSNAGNRIRLSGTVNDGDELRKVLAVAQQFSGDPVINALKVSDPQQVALEVRVLEASRDAGRDLGVNLRAAGADVLGATGARVRINAEDGVAQTFLQNDQGTNAQGVPFGTLVAKVLEATGFGRIDIIIDALEQKGLARRLAQPNLTTVSGETARFHVGGEVPIQTAVSNGGGVATSIDYRPFGVRLEFLPTVLNNSRINLRVLTEVSDIDGSINVNGNPGFRSRRAETVIDLRDGQSFAMAGLLETVNSKSIEQIPWIGQVPIIGALFRSSSFQKRETDLVIVVTPRLVRPASPDEKLYSPLDPTRPSNDIEFFALGLLEVDKDMVRNFRAGEGIVGPYGHLIDLEFEDGYVVKK